MRAMILAAGRGERMGELTQEIPKPLIRIGDNYLIEYSILALAKFGIKDLVINVCYRGEQIKNALGSGERYGLSIHYSEEKEALETGGGIFQALPLLGGEPFIVVSSDIVTDYDFYNLPKEPEGLAHLILVDNPIFHPKGDFSLVDHLVCYGQERMLTFGNIGLYRPELFKNAKPGRFRLSEVLNAGIADKKITGDYFQGAWYNVGSPVELAEARRK